LPNEAQRRQRRKYQDVVNHEKTLAERVTDKDKRIAELVKEKDARIGELEAEARKLETKTKRMERTWANEMAKEGDLENELIDSQKAQGSSEAQAQGVSVFEEAAAVDGVLRVAPELSDVVGLDQDFFCAAAKAGLVTKRQVSSAAAEDIVAKLCAVCPDVCDAKDDLVPEGWTRAAYGCAHRSAVLAPGRKLAHVQSRLEDVFHAKRARRTTVTVEPLPDTGSGKAGVFKATVCGLLYSGEGVEHFFSIIEDFRQARGAGVHQPGGVFASADVSEYVGPVFVSLADVPKLEPLPGHGGTQQNHMADKMAEVCMLVRGFHGCGGRMHNSNAAELVHMIHAQKECAELQPAPSPAPSPSAPAASPQSHQPHQPRPEHCHDMEVEGKPHYMLTYMIDVVDGLDETEGMARAIIQQVRAIHQVGGKPFRVPPYDRNDTVLCKSVDVQDDVVCDEGCALHMCTNGAGSTLRRSAQEAASISEEEVAVAQAAMRRALSSLDKAEASMAEAAAIASAETLDAADQLKQIEDLEGTIAAIEAGEAQLRDGSIATDAAGLTMQHESMLKTLRAVEAAESELGHTRAVSRERIDDVRRLASQLSGCPGDLMHEPRHSCRVRPSGGPRAGTSELWSGAVPCGPWGAAFSAKMQTFECPAPCPGAQCGQGGVVASVVHFGPVRLEIVGHVLTVHADGSSKTLKNTLRGKYHVGNGTTVEHGCPGQAGGGPGKEEADAYGCWTVEHLSGVSFNTRVSARTDTRSHFTIDLQMTVPASLASGAPCSKDALGAGGEPQPLASFSAELLPSPSPSARPRRALSAARSRHHHTLLAARDYTANALDDKDWPVLRRPDMEMDTGLSLFAPRVLDGVSSMCDAP
jgi:hypothetical protein